MFRYRNEAAFSKAFVAHLRNKGWFVQRIESGETGKGIPDIYAIDTAGESYWIELKRVHKSTAGSVSVQIPWRPGQQAWLHTVFNRGQRALTLACFDDCILQICHHTVWGNNTVPVAPCAKYYSLREI